MPETYDVTLFTPEGTRYEYAACTEAVLVDTANATELRFVFNGEMRVTNLPHIVLTHPATDEAPAV